MDPLDLVVIGAGPGGYVAAIRASQLGMKVALVEKDPVLGGTCLNVGCIPSKAILESSALYADLSERMAVHGIMTPRPELDLPTMLARKDKVVEDMRSGIKVLMRKNKIKVVRGHGRLLGSGRVLVTSDEQEPQELEARHIVLATGSVPMELPGLPFDGERVVTSTEALSFPEVPDHLLVVGAGAVGLELGSVWLRLGAQVTVIEAMPQLLPMADQQVVRLYQRSLTRQGMTIKTGLKVEGHQVSGGRVVLTCRDQEGEAVELEGDKVLVAAGRRPLTEGVGLEEAGVELTDRGRVKVDAEFKTTAPGVYAIGDLVPGPMLAHRAHEEGVAVAEILAGRPADVDHGTIPSVIYTEPELAWVGLTEAQAKEQGLPVRSGRSSFKANGRARAAEATDGVVKMVAHEETDRLLGATVMGYHASELLAEAVMVMSFAGTSEDLAATVHAHPTMTETLKEAALAVDGRAIHG